MTIGCIVRYRSRPEPRVRDSARLTAADRLHSVAETPELRHWVSQREGVISLHYILRESTRVQVQLFNMLGQPIATLDQQYRPAGEHRADYQPPMHLPKGTYVYRIRAGRREVSGKLVRN